MLKLLLSYEIDVEMKEHLQEVLSLVKTLDYHDFLKDLIIIILHYLCLKVVSGPMPLDLYPSKILKKT